MRRFYLISQSMVEVQTETHRSPTKMLNVVADSGPVMGMNLRSLPYRGRVRERYEEQSEDHSNEQGVNIGDETTTHNSSLQAAKARWR